MTDYFRNIRPDLSLKGKKTAFYRQGALYVAPEVFSLLQDEDVKDIVMTQVHIIDELYIGKQVAVYDDEKFMGNAKIVNYPLAETPGYAVVTFYDKTIKSSQFVVSIKCLKSI